MAYVALGKFSSGRDEVIYDMIVEGWAQDSDGDAESPTGYFWLLSNDLRETAEITWCFGTRATECDTDTPELIGHFIIVTDDRGFVHVTRHDTESAARAHFNRLADEYGEWLGDDPDC